MKSMIASALVLIGLAAAPVAASAASNDDVSYDDAMQCSALFSLLADSAEGSDQEVLQDMAARWLVYSMVRDGTEDGSEAAAQLIVKVAELTAILADSPDEASGEEFLNEGIDFCEGNYLLAADELDAIQL